MEKKAKLTLQGSRSCLATLGHSASIRIIGSAHGDGHRAGLSDNDFGLAGGGGDLGGGGCSGEYQDDDEGANDVFHFNSLLSCIYV